MNSVVSVVVPTYNHAHFLGRALQSVLEQTYQNLEVLVIDNHSRDNTDEVVGNFSDPRIRLLKIFQKPGNPRGEGRVDRLSGFRRFLVSG
jgi:glycosyltransferase involved in cell wall biosynthesis